MTVVRAYAKHRCQNMRAIYDDAITAVVAKIASGEKIIFLASIPGQGSRGRHIRLVLPGSARHDPNFGNQEPARSCRIYR